MASGSEVSTSSGSSEAGGKPISATSSGDCRSASKADVGTAGLLLASGSDTTASTSSTELRRKDAHLTFIGGRSSSPPCRGLHVVPASESVGPARALHALGGELRGGDLGDELPPLPLLEL